MGTYISPLLEITIGRCSRTTEWFVDVFPQISKLTVNVHFPSDFFSFCQKFSVLTTKNVATQHPFSPSSTKVLLKGTLQGFFRNLLFLFWRVIATNIHSEYSRAMWRGPYCVLPFQRDYIFANTQVVYLWLKGGNFLRKYLIVSLENIRRLVSHLAN